MQVLYFGWVRSKVGVSGEEIELPAEVTDVQTLISWLHERGGTYSEAFGDLSAIRVAVNQEMAELDTAIHTGDEVALFPPMTGG
ncbi:MAG: molybdopterin converting factor subunit 1 [Rhodospirillaceae bacterium]|jgi:molybdopterin synthase sulfur carrier subunit|nr:molybdopterin converting factor subunit 1 [Rhodospirillaceae bacterium]MBT5457072.1 molybdopterin converting factor subunit 1 [Rhodospirillaceae bacterium]